MTGPDRPVAGRGDMRKIKVRSAGFDRRQVFQVLPLAALGGAWLPDRDFLILIADEEEHLSFLRLRAAGMGNIFPMLCANFGNSFPEGKVIVGDVGQLQAGDVAVISAAGHELQVQYRTGDIHHAVFLTNRCNSFCLMCSQPPTKQDDSWLVDEAVSVIRHIPSSPGVIGLTGGEPLLLGERLKEVLDAVHELHPDSHIELLSNGRLLSDGKTAECLLGDLQAKVSWLVPLYGHADFLHDFVVQSSGAFDETIAGLLNLQAYRQAVQLRIVLIEPVLRILPQLCAFIGRNLPFVREVALMGCEPIGFALANRSLCETDLADWHESLLASVRVLDRAGIPALLMNMPLCNLPTSLWRYAHKSISDWKQTYVAECEPCALKKDCSGLFAWHERGWRPGAIIPIREVAL